MLIYNATKDDKDGWDFELKLSQNEIDYLVNFSVGQLLQAGMIELEQKEGEQKVDLPTVGTVN